MLDNPVGLIIALIGTMGLGGFLREIVAVFIKVSSGVSVKESNRKRDLVKERDFEYDRAEAEARNRRRIEEYAARLRRILVENGLQEVILPWPIIEEIPDRDMSVPGTLKNP